MNTDIFLANPARYFAGSYDRFLSFGGPSVYFHMQCLRCTGPDFLSLRHLELLYATLASWGMHRMGDPKGTKTRLREFDEFASSVLDSASLLRELRHNQLRHLPAADYHSMLRALEPIYRRLSVSVSDATVVANSKTLFHALPELVPPIDRQYTIRFFSSTPDRWFNDKGRFRSVALPFGHGQQFDLFVRTCLSIKRLADAVEPELLDFEASEHGVPSPKAIDNAIMNFVTLETAERRRGRDRGLTEG